MFSIILQYIIIIIISFFLLSICMSRLRWALETTGTAKNGIDALNSFMPLI